MSEPSTILFFVQNPFQDTSQSELVDTIPATEPLMFVVSSNTARYEYPTARGKSLVEEADRYPLFGTHIREDDMRTIHEQRLLKESLRNLANFRLVSDAPTDDDIGRTSSRFRD